MSTQTEVEPDRLLYPDSDGKPVADNTLQFQWIQMLQGNLDGLYRHNPEVFVTGDLLWYAQEGDPAVCVAPDVFVAFGRPKGYRGSYRQRQEGGVAPQVVFEVLSPSNTEDEMDQKLQFYDEHGVEEYYLYDPEAVQLSGWLRRGRRLRPVARTHGWVSPRLGIRFDLSGGELTIYRPDGGRFLTFTELMEQQELAVRRAEEERLQRESAEKAAAEAKQQRDRLAAKLRELGVDPDA